MYAVESNYKKEIYAIGNKDPIESITLKLEPSDAMKKLFSDLSNQLKKACDDTDEMVGWDEAQVMLADVRKRVRRLEEIVDYMQSHGVLRGEVV